jgi:hypothetical protein
MRNLAFLALAALLPSAAAAQIGNGSDVSGPGITNGGAAGGTYEAGGFRRSENAVFRTPNGIPLWASGEVACAVTAAVPRVSQTLRDGPLAARPEAGGAIVSDASREAIWQVMREDGAERDVAEEILAARLRGDAPAGSRVGRRARALSEALTGLLGRTTPCPPRDRFLVAEPWQDAIFAYERFLDAGGADAGGDTVAGVHAVLMTFMEAALEAANAPR